MSLPAEPTLEELASAVLATHALVMNGGVLHAVEVLKPAQLDRAIAGYERLGFAPAAEVLSLARTLDDPGKAAEEVRLDREYARAVPDDAALEASIDRLDPAARLDRLSDEPDEAVVETYRLAASEHGRATEAGDPRTANRAHRRLALAYRTLRARGPDSQSKLLELLRDPDPGVRAWTGAHALEFSPVAGEPVLVELGGKPGLIGFGARMTLREWRAGRLKFP